MVYLATFNKQVSCRKFLGEFCTILSVLKWIYRILNAKIAAASIIEILVTFPIYSA